MLAYYSCRRWCNVLYSYADQKFHIGMILKLDKICISYLLHVVMSIYSFSIIVGEDLVSKQARTHEEEAKRSNSGREKEEHPTTQNAASKRHQHY